MQQRIVMCVKLKRGKRRKGQRISASHMKRGLDMSRVEKEVNQQSVN